MAQKTLQNAGTTYDDHLRLIGKRVVDFLLVLIKLFLARLNYSYKRSNSICHVHCLAGNSTIIFFQKSSFFSLSSRSWTVWGVVFTCRVTSFTTCMQFRLLIRQYLTNWYKFCKNWTVTFSEHFGENRMILLQTVAKWRCIKLCAIFSEPLCICMYTVFQKKWRQNSNHYNYGISYQN